MPSDSHGGIGSFSQAVNASDPSGDDRSPNSSPISHAVAYSEDMVSSNIRPLASLPPIPIWPAKSCHPACTSASAYWSAILRSAGMRLRRSRLDVALSR